MPDDCESAVDVRIGGGGWKCELWWDDIACSRVPAGLRGMGGRVKKKLQGLEGVGFQSTSGRQSVQIVGGRKDGWTLGTDLRLNHHVPPVLMYQSFLHEEDTQSPVPRLAHIAPAMGVGEHK